MSSDTGKNRKPGTFVKGDARINRKGRPRNFNKLRLLAQAVACEVALDAEGQPMVHPVDGHVMTVVEVMLEQMSRDRKQRRLFFELAYGKVPDELNIHGDDGGPIPVRLVDYRKGLTDENGEDEPESG